MAFVACKWCEKEISKKAAVCPHCGYKPKRTSLFTWIVTIFVAVPLLIGIVISAVEPDSSSPSSPQEESPEQSEAERQREAAKQQRKLDSHRESYAIIFAEQAITNQLMAPSTADFSSILNTQIARLQGGGPNTWIVKGYVDAQNGFGAMIRNNYQVIIEFEEGKDTSYRILKAELY